MRSFRYYSHGPRGRFKNRKLRILRGLGLGRLIPLPFDHRMAVVAAGFPAGELHPVRSGFRVLEAAWPAPGVRLLLLAVELGHVFERGGRAQDGEVVIPDQRADARVVLVLAGLRVWLPLRLLLEEHG